MPITARAISWIGVRTERFEEMRRFLVGTIGLAPVEVSTDFAALSLPSGDLIELFGPTETEHRHFSTGPVPGLLVTDLATARADLEAAGVEFLGGTIIESSGYGWAHFRAPDGNVWELCQNPAHPAGRP